MDDYSVGKSGMSKDTGGMNLERGCTDVICTIVFCLFMGLMFGCTIYGIKEGDVSKMVAPIDGMGNFCGIGNQEGYGHLYFTDMSYAAGGELKPIFDRSVCVRQCPSADGEAI